MITITAFTLSSDFQTINLQVDAGVGETVDELYFWVGSAYLSSSPIDLTSRLSGIQIEDLTITKGELGITDDVISGIITTNVIGSDTTNQESSLFNAYYIDLALARKIANEDIQSTFNEIEVIYFLLKATKTYINSGFTEQALNTLERIEAMLEKYPDYMLTEDLPECAVGSGCWIYNGKYVIT
jgi:hypothetical protein